MHRRVMTPNDREYVNPGQLRNGRRYWPIEEAAPNQSRNYPLVMLRRWTAGLESGTRDLAEMDGDRSESIDDLHPYRECCLILRNDTRVLLRTKSVISVCAKHRCASFMQIPMQACRMDRTRECKSTCTRYILILMAND